jgi:hypothetical protein
MRQIGPVAVSAAVVICALLTACGPGPGPAPQDADHEPALVAFHDQGLAFWFPAPWHAFRHQNVSSFSGSIVDLATVDVPDPCITTPNELGGSTTACRDRFHLAPESVVVQVGWIGMPSFGIVTSRPAGAAPLVVGGQPAWLERETTTDPASGSEVRLSWTIARPGVPENGFQVRAFIRGPGAAEIEARVQAIVASIHLDP